MADLSLNTKQYLDIMRSIAAAMTLDDHVAGAKDAKPNKDLSLLWDFFMNKADDFGMSYPEDKAEGEHWGDEMFMESDEDLHILLEDEFWHILAGRMAEAQHAKACEKAAGAHDATCFEDVMGRVEKIEDGLGDDVFKMF